MFTLKVRAYARTLHKRKVYATYKYVGVIRFSMLVWHVKNNVYVYNVIRIHFMLVVCAGSCVRRTSAKCPDRTFRVDLLCTWTPYVLTLLDQCDRMVCRY